LSVNVEPKKGAGLDEDSTKEFLADRVGKHAVPEEVEFVEEIPLTPIGKVDKESLKS